MRKIFIATILATAIAGPALAQTTTVPPSMPPVAASPAAAGLALTADQATKWIDKAVYSSDNKKIGEVAAFARGTDNVVTEMHADIGGFLGLGETRVKLTPSQFKLQDDRVILNVTAEQAKDLPKITK